MLIKILVVIGILFLLRKHLGILKPHWHLCIGLVAGVIISSWIITLLFNYGLNIDAFEHLGIPKTMFKLIFVIVGTFIVGETVSKAIKNLVDDKDKEEQDRDVR